MSLRHRSTTRTFSLILAAAGLFAVPGFARADQVVYFTNGKAITVKTVEKGPKLTILEIEGGGRIGIPTVQIDRIEDLNLSPATPGVPQAQVTAIIPQQPTAPAVQTVPQPQSAVPAGPGTGGHVAQNSALKMAPPLSVGGEPGDTDLHPAAPPAQATQSTPPGGMMGRQVNRGAGMMGGPGAMQRGRRGYNPYSHGLPSGAQTNPGAAPQGAPATGAAPGQPNAAGQPNTAGQPNAASRGGSGQAAAGSQAAQSGQPSQQAQQPPPQPQAPPPAAVTPPPPPPPDPEPNDSDSGNSDSTDDGSSSPDNDNPSGGDSGN